jgi:alkanesulfonate monooxygenase SsuD/methylene tetrahydromethanopterin reductase-like flavin-dependent oxidoreductase (luciferase family)
VRFAINVPNFGPYADVAAMADLARIAEEGGWDGLFVWDHVTWLRSDPQPVADPWILLTAVALATTKLRIGTMITPVARRRPAKLVRETATLDRLSGGRLTLGVGLGSPLDDEFRALGEPGDPKLLATRLDEGLDILAAAWSGQPVHYTGVAQRVEAVTFLPRPVQRPRIPIWVGGTWPNRGPVQRALRWDGAVFTYLDRTKRENNWRSPTPAEIIDLATQVRQERGSLDGFDIVVSGRARHTDRDLVPRMAAAGATWWQESFGPWLEDWPDTVRQIRRGPLR